MSKHWKKGDSFLKSKAVLMFLTLFRFTLFFLGFYNIVGGYAGFCFVN